MYSLSRNLQLLTNLFGDKWVLGFLLAHRIEELVEVSYIKMAARLCEPTDVSIDDFAPYPFSHARETPHGTVVSEVKYSVVDLFAGVGGLSLGFERAKATVVAAVESDPHHADAYRSGHRHEVALFTSPIEDVSAQRYSA